MRFTFLFQDFEKSFPSENTPLPLFFYGDTSNNIEHYGDFVEDHQRPVIATGETSELRHGQEFVDAPEQYEMETKPVKEEYFVESSANVNLPEFNYSLDEPYLDATDDPQLGDGLFLESNDLLNPVESDPAGFDILDEYLTFLNEDDDNSQYMAFDPSEIMGTGNTVSEEAPLTPKVN